MHKTLAAALLAAVLLPACTNSYELRYKAVPQPKNHELFADFSHLQGAVSISIDTGGHRLEDIFVRTPDGVIVRPTRIDYPGYTNSASIGPGIGIGPVGVGVGFPVGPKHAEGLTTAIFAADRLGPPPWEVHVEVYDTGKAVFPAVGGPPTVKPK